MSDAPAWGPSASLQVLATRANMLAAARAFFRALNVQEVDIPALSPNTVTDAQIASLKLAPGAYGQAPVFLHTSPEFAMKRLLAAGSPDIYQLGKVYRDGELGRHHQPEFTLIEWYRRGQKLEDMVAETCALIRALAAKTSQVPPVGQSLRYREAFLEHAGIDPLAASTPELAKCAAACVPGTAPELGDDRDGWLDLLLSTVVAPALPADCLTVLSHYPASQAALARLDAEDPRLAERFEIFWQGVELANGYRELTNSDEQRQRFAADRSRREAIGRPDVEPDEAFLAALAAGLPDCCGVAVGFDRVLMLALGCRRLDEVVSFPLAPGAT